MCQNARNRILTAQPEQGIPPFTGSRTNFAKLGSSVCRVGRGFWPLGRFGEVVCAIDTFSCNLHSVVYDSAVFLRNGKGKRVTNHLRVLSLYKSTKCQFGAPHGRRRLRTGGPNTAGYASRRLAFGEALANRRYCAWVLLFVPLRSGLEGRNAKR